MSALFRSFVGVNISVVGRGDRPPAGADSDHASVEKGWDFTVMTGTDTMSWTEERVELLKAFRQVVLDRQQGVSSGDES